MFPLGLSALQAIDALIEAQCGWQEAPSALSAQAVASGPAQFNLDALVDSTDSANCFVEYTTQTASIKPPSIILHLDYLKERLAHQAIHPVEVLFLKRLFDYARVRGMPIFLWQTAPPYKQMVYSDDEVWTHLKRPEPAVRVELSDMKRLLSHAGENSSSYRFVFNASRGDSVLHEAGEELQSLMINFGSFAPTFSSLSSTEAHAHKTMRYPWKSKHPKKYLSMSFNACLNELQNFPFEQYTNLIKLSIEINPTYFKHDKSDYLPDEKTNPSLLTLDLRGLPQLKKLTLYNNSYKKYMILFPEDSALEVLNLDDWMGSCDFSPLHHLKSLILNNTTECSTSSDIVLPNKLEHLTLKRVLNSNEWLPSLKKIHALKTLFITEVNSDYFLNELSELSHLNTLSIKLRGFKENIIIDFSNHTQLTNLTINKHHHAEDPKSITAILPASLKSLSYKHSSKFIMQGAISQIEELYFSGKIPKNGLNSALLPNLKILTCSSNKNIKLNLNFPKPLDLISLKRVKLTKESITNAACLYSCNNNHGFFNLLPAQRIVCLPFHPTSKHKRIKQNESLLGYFFEGTPVQTLYLPSHSPHSASASSSASSQANPNKIASLYLTEEIKIDSSLEVNSKINLPENPEYMAVFFKPGGKQVPATDLRIMVYNYFIEEKLKQDDSQRITLNPTHCIFNQEILLSQSSSHQGTLRIKRQSEIAYPLATDFITEFGALAGLIFYDEDHRLLEKELFQLSFCPVRSQYFIEPATGAKWPNIILCKYFIKDLKKKNNNNEVVIAEKRLLSNSTIKTINEIFRNHPLLAIIKSDLTIKHKLDAIQDYMRSIPNEVSEPVPSPRNSNITSSLSLIKDHKGACRHRALVFMLLAQYLRVPALFEGGDRHARCDIPFETGLKIYDLGGVSGEIKSAMTQQVEDSLLKPTRALMPQSTHATLSPSTLNQGSTSERVEAVIKPASIASNEEIETAKADLDRYKLLFDHLTTKRNIEAWEEINAHEPTLVLHNAAYSAQSLYTDFLSTIKTNQSVFYINSPIDFIRFLEPCGFRDGRKMKLAGPLKHCLDHGEPILFFVNGDTFSDTELITYKSIADTTPTLCDNPLSANVQVIWLMNENRPLSDAFPTRFVKCRYHPKQMPLSPVFEVLSEVVEVNLHHRFDWKNLLFYPDVEYRVLPDHSATRILLGESPLERVLAQGKKLKIINPPKNNVEFDLFYFRFMTERRVWINGAWKNLLESPTYIELEEQVVEAISQVDFIASPEAHQRRICLSANTFYQLYQEMTYHAEGAVEKNAGLLASYQEGDVFYLQGHIPRGLWETLIHAIQHNYANKSFCFSFAPGAQIEGVNSAPPAQVEEIASEEKISIFFTNDPFYLAKQKQKEEGASIITVSPETTVNDVFLLRTLDQQKLNDTGLTGFSSFERELLQRLRAGEKIVLQGSISQALYNALQPFLRSNGRYFSNGCFESLPGKLSLVMPNTATLLLNGELSETVLFNWNDYQSNIADEDNENFYRLRAFYEKSLCLPVYSRTLRQGMEWTGYKIQHALSWMKDGDHFHPNNPIKSFLLYEFEKDSAEYAFLNVLGKYYFNSASESIDSCVNQSKLLGLIKQQFNCDPYACYKKIELSDSTFLFKLLNCFDAKKVKEILGDIDETIITAPNAFPQLSDYVKEKLFSHIEQIIDGISKNAYSKKENKQREQLEILINKNEKLITLMGDEGAGKSYMVRMLLREQYDCFELSQFQSWLDYRGDKKAILLLDEFNLLPEEHWHDLQRLIQSPEEHPQQVVVATGNPPHYPLRHRQSLFQQAAHTIWFNRPSLGKLKKQLLTHLHEDEEDKQVTANTFVKACAIYNKWMPWQKISFREFDNILMCLNILRENQPDTELVLIKKAILMELVFSLPSSEARSELEALLSYKKHETGEVISLRPGFAIPASRSLLYDTLCLDLSMREALLVQSEKTLNNFKHGVLIEGDSGVGKSTLFEEILKSRGYAKEGENPKKYSMMSSGTLEQMKTQLETAFHEGSVVILDELNLYPGLEELLNQLMCGTDRQGKPAEHPGFFVLASQNPCMAAGRQPQSAALRSRFHHLYVDNYHKQELDTLLDYYQVKSKPAFFKAWQDTGGHTRTFFKALKEESPVLQSPYIDLA